jgi:caffeoyl-CoA O-methyltransferase
MNNPRTLTDTLLPDQLRNNEYYGGSDYHRDLYDLIAGSSGMVPLAEAFTLTLSDEFTIDMMASNPIQLRLLELFVRLVGATRVIEIGAFIGLSAMTMARAMPAGGKLITIEKYDHFADICRRNVAANGLADRIDVIEGDALDVIGRLPPNEPFDLAFIDGNKERYVDHFRLVEPYVRTGGIILVDDVLYHGDVFNATPKTAKGEGVKAFMDMAAGLGSGFRAVLPVCNGLMIIQK